METAIHQLGTPAASLSDAQRSKAPLFVWRRLSPLSSLREHALQRRDEIYRSEHGFGEHPSQPALGMKPFHIFERPTDGLEPTIDRPQARRDSAAMPTSHDGQKSPTSRTPRARNERVLHGRAGGSVGIIPIVNGTGEQETASGTKNQRRATKDRLRCVRPRFRV